jgi:hypothetical protein
MIESVRIYKNNRTVEVRYQSGNKKTHMDLNDKETAFILREDVKAFENEYSIMYRIA